MQEIYLSTSRIAELLKLHQGSVSRRAKKFLGGRPRAGKKGLEYPLSGLPAIYKERICEALGLDLPDEACPADDELISAHLFETQPGQQKKTRHHD
jgi:hypothetical protein